MYNEKTGINTAMICLLYVTQVLERYETYLDTYVMAGHTKYEHVCRMEQHRKMVVLAAKTDKEELQILRAEVEYRKRVAAQTAEETERLVKEAYEAATERHQAQQIRAHEQEIVRIAKVREDAAIVAHADLLQRSAAFARRRAQRRNRIAENEALYLAELQIAESEAIESYKQNALAVENDIRLKRRISHGVLDKLPFVPKNIISLLVLLMIITMSFDLRLITVLKFSGTLKKLHEALLALVLLEGLLWFFGMLIATLLREHSDLPWFYNRNSPPFLPQIVSADHHPSLMEKCHLPFFCGIFILGAAPVLSNYVLLVVFFWDRLYGCEHGCCSPCLIPGFQSTHLVLLKLCTQGFFVVLPSVVVSHLVMSGTSCPVSCRHPATGVSICSVDSSLSHQHYCLAATCTPLFKSATNGSMDPMCFLDTTGGLEAFHTLVVSVISLASLAAVALATFAFRAALFITDSYCVLFTECGLVPMTTVRDPEQPVASSRSVSFDVIP